MLDTWFSSAFVPFSTLGWPDEATFERERRFYLPSTVLVTGFDIIFFWVARMVMTTLHFTGETAFRDVYINAIVRDAEGQKMSKSKGNTLDPLDLIDGIDFEALLDKSTQGLMLAAHKEAAARRIKRDYPEGIPSYGADALRFTFASLSTLGRTLNFDLKRCEGYRNFCNKLWNATRFVLMNCEGKDVGLDEGAALEYSTADRWIASRLQRAERAVVQALAEYRFDVAARSVYEFVWDEYCDWYVELAKVQMQGGQRSAAARHAPHADPRARGDAAARPPDHSLHHRGAVAEGGAARRQDRRKHHAGALPGARRCAHRRGRRGEIAMVKEVVNAARNLRSTMGLSPAAKVPLYVADHAASLPSHQATLAALARLSEVHFVKSLPAEDAPVAITGAAKVMLHVEIDRDAERARLAKEIERIGVEMEKARNNLGNEAFAAKAPPAVVDQMKKRLADFEAKHADLRTQLAKLG